MVLVLGAEWLKPPRRLTSDRLSTDALVQEMNDALKLPGTSNAWTMPIKARTDMLTTGIRTPVGIKIYGSDIKEIERIGTRSNRCCPPCRAPQCVRRTDLRRLLRRLQVEA